MTSLTEALADYLRIRRGEGVQFKKVGPALEHFVEFLEERGAERVTVELAVEWATLATDASDRHRANRLTMVRGFAAYLRSSTRQTRSRPGGCCRPASPRTGSAAVIRATWTGTAQRRARPRRLMVGCVPRLLTICGSAARSATS